MLFEPELFEKEYYISDKHLGDKLKTDKDQKAFENTMKDWEWNWVNQTNPFPTQISGNAIIIAKQLHQKYGAMLTDFYKTAKKQINKKTNITENTDEP